MNLRSASHTLSVLDLRLIDSIRSLNSEGRPDLLAELVGIFSETTPALLGSLDDCIVAGNAPMVQRVAHRLKGASGNVGARYMSRLCSELESLVRESPAETLEFKRFSAEIRSAFNESLGALSSLL